MTLSKARVRPDGGIIMSRTHLSDNIQRTGISNTDSPYRYQLHPGFPDAGTPIDIEFVHRPYAFTNIPRGVTPEALIALSSYHLQDLKAKGLTDDRADEAIDHLERALNALHRDF